MILKHEYTISLLLLYYDANISTYNLIIHIVLLIAIVIYVFPIVWKTQQITYSVIYYTQCAYIIEMQEDRNHVEPQIA